MPRASRYETIAPIGSGGMASVFVARVRGEDEDRLVALKRALPHVKKDARLASSMKLEAHLAARVQHPNVVSVLDVEEEDGDLVLVLDYVEGCTLRLLTNRLADAGERRPRELLRVLLDIAAGLHQAHRTTDDDGRLLGIVHRDVSPSNVLVGVDGVSRLSDFGIAKVLFEGSDRTEAGVLKGKCAYMAPEYVIHQRSDALSDLFSFSVVAWEALAGQRLFRGASEIETLSLVAQAKTRLLSDERPELAALDEVFVRALAAEPEDRHESVAEMAAELEGVARELDLVGSHAEVGILVERLAEPELEKRRRILRADLETQIGTVRLTPELKALARSVSEPQLVAPYLSAPPQLAAPAYLPAAHLSAPHLSAARISVAPAQPSAPPKSLSSQPLWSSQQVAPLEPPPALPRPPPTEIADESGRWEKLALVGALMLLALALGWMWTQLQDPPPALSDGVDTADALPPAPAPAPPGSSASSASLAARTYSCVRSVRRMPCSSSRKTPPKRPR